MATVAGGVTSIVFQAALGADPVAISTWFFGAIDGLMARIQAGYALNRRSTMDYLSRHGALNGARVSPVPGSLDVGSLRSRLEITGPVAFKTSIGAGRDTQAALRSMATQMSGVADESVRNGDRDVITRTIRHGSGVLAYRRRLAGHSCGFCAMLASRGAVYGADSGNFRAHGHCRCWLEPVYRRQIEPPEVQRLQRQWQRVTSGQTGKDKARAWRRHWESGRVDQAALQGPIGRAVSAGIPPLPVAAATDPALKMTLAELKAIIKANNLSPPLSFFGTRKADIVRSLRDWERTYVVKLKGLPEWKPPPVVRITGFENTPPLGVPATRPTLSGSALNDWADYFRHDFEQGRFQFTDAATGDTVAAGVRVRDLRVLVGAYDGSYPSYVVAEGTAWRINGISYLIEHGPGDYGAPWVSRALTELRAAHDAIPAAVRANKSYAVLQRPSPADSYWQRKFNNPAHTGAMSAGNGHVSIYNFKPTASRIEQKVDSLRHETGHNLDSVFGHISGLPRWEAAADSDAVWAARIQNLSPTHYQARDLAKVEQSRGFPKGVTGYGRSSAAEDFAESVMLYQLGPIATGRVPGVVIPKLTGVKLPPGVTAITDREILYFRDIYPARAAILDKYFPDIAKAQQAEIAALRAPKQLEVPLAKRTVAELRALAKERGLVIPPKSLKADIVRILEAPPLTKAEIRAAEQKALREAARVKAAQIETATGTSRLLAEIDQLLAQKADIAVIRQRLSAKLIEREQLFAGADPAIREALAAAAESGDPAALRLAVTRAGTKAKIKPISKAGTKTKFDADTMEPVGGQIKAGTQVTVVTRGASVTLPDGTVVQIAKAKVTPVVKPVKAVKVAEKPVLAMQGEKAPAAAIRTMHRLDDKTTGMKSRVTGITHGANDFEDDYAQFRGWSQVDIEISSTVDPDLGGYATIIVSPDGRTVYFPALALETEAQGQGFVTRLMGTLFDRYKAAGVKTLGIRANADVGGYAWARAGFTFFDDSARAEFARYARAYARGEAVKRYTPEHAVFGANLRAKLDPATRRAILAIADNPNAQPIDYAMIGHVGGSKLWPGKEFMLGAFWRGKIEL